MDGCCTATVHLADLTLWTELLLTGRVEEWLQGTWLPCCTAGGCPALLGVECCRTGAWQCIWRCSPGCSAELALWIWRLAACACRAHSNLLSWVCMRGRRSGRLC